MSDLDRLHQCLAPPRLKLARRARIGNPSQDSNVRFDPLVRRPTNGRLRNKLTLSNPLTWTEPREVKRSALRKSWPGVRTPVRSQ